MNQNFSATKICAEMHSRRTHWEKYRPLHVRKVSFQASGRKVTISLPLRGREMSLPAAVGLKNRIQPTGSKISNPPDHVYITLGFASGVKHVIWDISYFTSLGE